MIHHLLPHTLITLPNPVCVVTVKVAATKCSRSGAAAASADGADEFGGIARDDRVLFHVLYMNAIDQLNL